MHRCKFHQSDHDQIAPPGAGDGQRTAPRRWALLTQGVLVVALIGEVSSGAFTWRADAAPGAGAGSKGKSPMTSVARHQRYPIPPVGAPGFPSAIYPAPSPRPVVNLIGHCPSVEGVQPFRARDVEDARRLLRNLGRSFTNDLRLTDRTLWPVIAHGWRIGTPIFVHSSKQTITIIFNGRLESYRSSEGPPDLTHLIATRCGERLARDSWMFVTGPRSGPALQGEFLFLDRRHHVLLYFVE